MAVRRIVRNAWRPTMLARLAALGLAGAILAGCDTSRAFQEAQARRQAALMAMVGRTEADVIRQFGLPQQTYEADGRKFVAYNQPSPFFDPSLGGAPMVCQTMFEIFDGKVQSASLHGPC